MIHKVIHNRTNVISITYGNDCRWSSIYIFGSKKLDSKKTVRETFRFIINKTCIA